MMKKKKIILNGIILIFVVAAAAIAVLVSHNHFQKSKSIRYESVPTLFFHGWGSSSHAEESMVNYAREHGVTNTIVRADVDAKGKVTFVGKITPRAQNPIIKVNLANNKSYKLGSTKAPMSFSQSSQYVKDVVVALQKRYQFKKINFVGHSMGNLQISYYLKNNFSNKTLPQLNKQVSIAGHYNGLVGRKTSPQIFSLNKEGCPSKMDAGYRGLLPLRKTYPEDAMVLNIYGDTGDGTDGDVQVKSAQTFCYLTKRSKSYQEKEFKGPNAQHSKLHENKKVAQTLVDFLWQK